MKEFSKEEMKLFYQARRLQLAGYLKDSKTDAAVFIDSEEHRDPSIAYYTGHPSDAVLIIFSSAYSVLIPWDENLAKQNADFDKLVPYTRYKNNSMEAVKAVLNANTNLLPKSKIELPPYLTYLQYLKFIDCLGNFECHTKDDGAYYFTVKQRRQKDNYEIQCLKEAARIGDLIIDQIEEKIRSGEIKTEMDCALFIERECRIHGCERTGFDTLCAGPSRSFAIHAFPGYTSSPWPAKGLSILDFGVVYRGYTSDTTVTVAMGELTPQQEEQIALVQKAYDQCLKLYTPEHLISDAAKKADSVFAQAKRKMPHTLGHAIGLEIHESPRVSTRPESEINFEPGMVLTLEPGLYDPEIGGTRLENDVLITETGNEVITHSRIIRIN